MTERVLPKTILKLKSQKFADFFASQPETGMEHWVTNVVLTNGSEVRHVVVDSGYITKINGMMTIPFDEADIDHFVVTHEKLRDMPPR